MDGNPSSSDGGTLEEQADSECEDCSPCAAQILAQCRVNAFSLTVHRV